MPLPEQSRRLTEAEYLEIERAADFKSEFFGGEMFAMAGGTPQHSLIATNLAREFGNRLKSSHCLPYNADLRIKVETTGLCTYPDLSVICGQLQFAEGTDDTVLNPTLLVEVLSPSTEAYDRGENLSATGKSPACRNIFWSVKGATDRTIHSSVRWALALKRSRRTACDPGTALVAHCP